MLELPKAGAWCAMEGPERFGSANTSTLSLESLSLITNTVVPVAKRYKLRLAYSMCIGSVARRIRQKKSRRNQGIRTMKLRDVRVEQRIETEAAALELESRGDVIIIVGETLLWFDLILLCFVLVGLRTGSHLFLYWAIAEALLGVVLVAIGIRHKSQARRTLNTLDAL